MIQQCTYQNRLHHDGYGQVKDYNEYIQNLSLLNQEDLFQYINILHHKSIAQFYKKLNIYLLIIEASYILCWVTLF